MAANVSAPVDALDEELRLSKRLLAITQARASLLAFTRLMMPDPEDPDDPDLSLYEVEAHHRVIAEALERLEKGESLRLALSIPPQFGKALALDTPIATPTGWTTMGELSVGDEVFDEIGEVTHVVAVSEVFRNREVFRVSTDDRDDIIADGEHLWKVRLDRKRPVRTLRNTKYLADRASPRAPMIDVQGALQLPEADLLVDPYVLGVWLGDGNTADAGMCSADPEIIAEVERREGAVNLGRLEGITQRFRATFGRRSGKKASLQGRLRQLGVLNNKHIPPQYLRASIAQRKALLQGLIDTDGDVAAHGLTTFSTRLRLMAEDVRELVHSLGRKAVIYEGRARLNGRDYGPSYRVCFHMKDSALLPRKAKRTRDGVKPFRRYITVEPAGVADTVCIQVAAPSGMFLCGRSMLPTHNSTLFSRMFPAWYLGRNPYKNIFFGTYSDKFAQEFGGEVRDLIESARFRQVFPRVRLRKGSAAKDHMVTEQGGRLSFVGRGGAGSGKPADLVVIDDPLKNGEEAESPAVIKELHDWWTKVVYARCKATTAIGVVHTRWIEDDLIGRMCDPDHPHHDRELAADWTYVNIPAVLGAGPLAQALGAKLEVQTDPIVLKEFGDKPIASLWPARFTLRHLATAKRQNPIGFGALYMGKPTPDDGYYFKAEWLQTYERGELPTRLRMYGASDHAVTEKTQNDPNVIGCIGVDERDEIWVMPDLTWEHMTTDRVVEEILAKMQLHKPALWWMENELISRSFGPFLIKRMHETKTYTALVPVTPHRDKRARAQAIRGRMAMRKVHFPRFAHWWPNARGQLLRFPLATHDDFVDWLAWAGLGMLAEHAASGPTQAEVAAEKAGPRTGSIVWLREQTKFQDSQKARRKAVAGW